MPFSSDLAKALETGDLNKVAHLITEEKAWDEPNEEGLKPIHVAIDYGHLDVVDWLLKNGVSLECGTVPNSSTPLHRAAFKGQIKIVEHLLKVYQDNPNKKRADGVTPLYFAAYQGHTTAIALLLDKGADIYQAANDGSSPLYTAACYGHKEIVALLLARGADIHQANHKGASPLYVAAQNGHTATVALLLDHHADIQQANNNGASPLYIAACKGHKETVALLLDRHADIRQANNHGASPLYVAAQEGHTETVALLLDRGADIHQANNHGASPLYAAAQEGHTETVALLLDRGADIRQANNNGTSPLYIAAQEGHTKAVALLLDRGADIRQTNNHGTSSLYIAAQEGRTETVALLLDHGADIREENNHGADLLHVAVYRDHTAIVALLLDHHADIHPANNNGASLLYVAAQEGHTKTVALLLDRGADIRQANNNNISPLWIAAQNGHTATVALLLEHHADIQQAAKDGVNPLWIAAQNGHTETVALLLDHHADIRQADHDGINPLYIAAQNGRTETVALLLDRHADIQQAKNNGTSPLFIAAQNGHTETVALLLDRHADIEQATNEGASPLYAAAFNGHTETVSLLLDRGADTRQANNNNISPLWIAAQNGHTATVALLLEHHADIQQAAKDGVSPLWIAAQNGHTETVAFLLDHHADIRQADHDGINPLYIAAQNGRTETVALLLDRNADIQQAKKNGTSPLFIAAQNGHTETVALLLDRHADIEQATNEGASPLYAAAFNGHTATVALLLERNADIQHADKDGTSAIYIAAQNGHTETVTFLLERHADIRQAKNDGTSPLYIAALAGHPETVALLLKHGAPVEQARLQRTPLWIAAHQGHAQIVEILLTSHALMTPDLEGDTPLHIAVRQGHLSVVKILLLHNAPVTALNAKQETPLMLAATTQDAVMFAWLLAAWFKKQSGLTIQEAEHQQDLESKKTQGVSSSPDNYNYEDDTYKIVSVIAEQVLPQDISQWPLLLPAALTRAKATRQSLSLALSQEQLQLAVKLGEGAFGEVFRARLPFGSVALKRMKLTKMAEWFKVSLEEAQAILQWEISQLEKVRHPHVVELLSVTHSETPLVAMELCNTTLDKALPKAPYAQWQVAWEVACGLAYLHGLSLVHRDIKPENILLKEGIAKIADMGLAQIDPLLIDKAEPAQLQSLIGDTQWASPEEKAAFKAYHLGKGSLEDIKTVSTAATDIYRYGLVLNTFYQQMWRPIIEACLQQDPKTRPSALQVLGALERNIPHSHPLLAKLCQRLGIFAHYHQHELAHFLIPWVSPKPEIDWLTYQEGIEVRGADAPQPFNTLWQDFLSTPEKRLLDVRGAGGLGKTLLGYYQLKEHWQALRQWLIKPEGNPPTLVLLLTPNYLPSNAFTFEERLAEIYQLSPEECATLKQYPVVFLLDGEDEWQARPQLDLTHWANAKTWIVGRPSPTAKDSVYLLPFNQVQIVNYLRQSLAWDEATTQDFITQLPVSAIKEVLRNPFVLSMFRLLWPIADWQELTKEAIYHTYFTQFIERQQQHWLTGPYRKIYEELIKHLQQEYPTLSASYLRFAGEVSLQLFEARRLEGKVAVDSPWTTLSEKVQNLAEAAFKEKQQLLLVNHEKTHLTLQQYQTFTLAHLQRFVMPAPLEFGYYRFRHKSLFEYAWAYSALLPNRPLEEDEALLTTYALIHQKEKEEKLDFSLIEATKKDLTFSRKAGNLLTLYNWARLPLTYDYQGAHIENANLAYANLIQADFRNAHLNNCYFANACIKKANFDKVPDRTLKHNRPHPPLLGHNQPISYSAMSSNGQLLATLDSEQVFIWHKQQRVRHFLTHIGAPTALAIDDSGALLIGDKEGFVYFYTGNTRQRKLHAYLEPITGVEFISEDHCWVRSANDNSVYHRKHYTRGRQWPNGYSVTCSAFHSLSGQHALGTEDGVVALKSIKEALVKKIWGYSLHQGASTALSFSLTGSLATGGRDGKIVIFEQNHRSPLQTLYTALPIKGLHWSRDSQLLVAITSQGFKIWDVFGMEQRNFKAVAIQAIYMKDSHEGVLVEKNGNLYGIVLNNRELNITWMVPGEYFQGGIAIETINEASQEEKRAQPTPEENNKALLSSGLQQQGLFADRNQSDQEQRVSITYDPSHKTRSSICSLL